jgi:hypothetical protein
MKKTKENTIKANEQEEDMLSHYEFDYSQAKPNRFAAILAEQEGYVKLDSEIQKVFKSSEEVNNFLLSIIKSYPKSKTRKTKVV